MSLGLGFYDKMALSQLTSLEKQSLYQLLCAAMVVDGNRDPREMAVINEVKQLTGMTASDLEASRKLTEPVMTSCLRNMEDFKKMYVGKFIAQVVLADGVVSDIEEKFFYYLHDKLGLPNID